MNTETTEPISALDKEIQEHYRQNATESYEEVARYFANWQREQMMAKAVDVTIAIPYPRLDGIYTQLVESKEALPFGDNIKVLVIKEG